jgi:hypothetical protein
LLIGMHVVMRHIKTPTTDPACLQMLQQLDRAIFPTEQLLGSTELASLLHSKRTLLLVAAAPAEGAALQTANECERPEEQAAMLQ